MSTRSLRPSLLARGSALLVLGAAFTAPAADWPQWRGLNRDGISTETGWLTEWPKDGPRRLWGGKVGLGWSSVAVVGERVYTLGNVNDADQILCLNAATGALLWRYEYFCLAADLNGYPGPRSTPTVDGRLVFTLSRHGQLFCLNAENGRVIWSVDLVLQYGARAPTWGLSGSPLIEGGLVIVETGAPAGRSVMAFDKFTGRVQWQSGFDFAGYSSPVALEHKGERQVVVFSSSGLTGRAANNGRVLWIFPWQTQYGVNAATPVLFGDKVFISSGYNRGCALIEFGGKEPKTIWTNTNMRNHCTSCVLWQGHLYGFDDNQLRCLDLVTGEVRWTQGGFGKGSLLIADGKLVIYGEAGRLAVAEATPAGYFELSGAQVLGGRSTWAPPVLASGRIYCRSQDYLVCVDVRGKQGESKK